MEQLKELMNPILDKDEEIIKIYKPNKRRVFVGVTFVSLFIGLFAILACCGFIFDEGANISVSITITVVSFLAVVILVFLMYSLWYKKVVFAVTNKRILIRTGFIGVDYKSLEMTTIGAVNVNMGIVDKMIGGKTGSISFGSMSSPMVNTKMTNFNFFYIENPYETYKEIKTIIDEYKSSK